MASHQQSDNQVSSFGLHWFRHDLRVNDNEALLKLSRATGAVVGIYVFDPSWEQENKLGMLHLGEHRKAFIQSALNDLKKRMQALGSDLIVLEGNPVELLSELSKQVSHISYETHNGFNERREVEQLKSRAQDTTFIEGGSNYLYELNDLPFAIENMPDTFSPTRRKLEKYATPRLATEAPDNCTLAQLSLDDFARNLLADVEAFRSDNAKHDLGNYTGGETAALERIEDYFFASDNIASYKETRNGLDGWDFSSRLSAFLAHGCISPATVLSRLKEYEAQRVANDSTYWLFFELLWREFFHLNHLKHGSKFFEYTGIQNKSPQTKLDREKFEAWCKGETGYNIVDASMRQLNATGFMSNRARQLVASCFVHELHSDWRWGAAYFEQQLIDFDVASNWGNWQYLAGVGSDPRGHRQFNLDKQTQTYDPNQQFINKWLET